jgi:hypothetical protein
MLNAFAETVEYVDNSDGFGIRLKPRGANERAVTGW